MSPAADLREPDLEDVKAIFLASLNHEIRTPLSGVLGMIDLLLETRLDDEQRDYVKTARACAENLFEILNSALEYSALEAGRVVLDESEFNLKETLQSAVEQHSAQAAAKGLELRSRLGENLPQVAIGDAGRIGEIAGHLIANAIKFTAAGFVELRAWMESGPSLTLEVSDTGIGIPNDRLTAIFDSFHQVENGLSRAFSGLGLGLAVVRKLVALMHGSIDVESEPDHGSTFTVHMPLRLTGEPNPGHPPATAPRILVVEDNPVGLRILRHALARRPVRADYVDCGRAAIEAASARRYDLVLMDLQMPGMDGLETAAVMRRMRGCESIPILALTADCADEMRERCRQAGMQGFLTKPVEPERLWSAVSRFLAARS